MVTISKCVRISKPNFRIMRNVFAESHARRASAKKISILRFTARTRTLSVSEMKCGVKWKSGLPKKNRGNVRKHSIIIVYTLYIERNYFCNKKMSKYRLRDAFERRRRVLRSWRYRFLNRESARPTTRQLNEGQTVSVQVHCQQLVGLKQVLIEIRPAASVNRTRPCCLCDNVP